MSHEDFMSKHRPALRVELTDEQILLYHESPSFKAAVTAFITGVAPLFFAGAAERAKQDDWEMKARMRTVMEMDPLTLPTDATKRLRELATWLEETS